jgi:hypothetical protein
VREAKSIKVRPSKVLARSAEGSIDSKPISPFFYPPATTFCSKPFSDFLTEYHANLDSFFFVITLVSRSDENRVRAAKALKDTAKSDEERKKYEENEQSVDLVLKQLQKHSTVHSQGLTNGSVSAFQRYFSGIIQSAALKRPIMLSSSQTIRLDDVLKFTRHKDLVAFIVDKKVNELGYAGLNEMEAYFLDRLGVQIFSEDRERQLLRLFVEARNINVYNGGMVNDLFLSRVGKVEGYKFEKARKFHIDFDSLVALSENAMRVAMHIDEVVSTKFRLKRQAHKIWAKKP